MAFRARLYGLIATGVPVAGTLTAFPAWAQAEEAGKLVDRIASDAPVMVVVVLVVVGAAAWMGHIQTKRHEDERTRWDTSREAERLRHEKAQEAALEKFISALERIGKLGEAQTLAQERMRDAVADASAAVATVGADMRVAISKSDNTSTEIRAAIFEVRDALRSRAPVKGRAE